MPERRSMADFSLQAPVTARTLVEDWKLEAACASYDGPVMDIPTSLCAVCPVREECNSLYLGMQADIDAEKTEHATRVYLGGVWGGVTRREARHSVRRGSVPIEACGDECDRPRFARGACKTHYQFQYDRWKRGRKIVLPPRRRLCSLNGCNRKHEAKGLCQHHYHISRKAA